jgi:hypothetical protein
LKGEGDKGGEDETEFGRGNIVDLQTALQYFSFFGALIAIALGILKIREYFRDKPILLIRESNCYYTYGKKEMDFTCSIELTNIGRRTTTVKEILVDVLDDKKKRLTIHSRVFRVRKMLEPGAYLEIPLDFTIHEKMPQKTYFIRAKARATHKEYTRTILTPYATDFAELVYKEIEDGKKKGLVE